MKKVIFTMMLVLGMAIEMDAQFVISKGTSNRGCKEMERISVYSNLFVNKQGNYYLRVNSVSNNGKIYIIDLGNKDNAKESLDVLIFFRGHINDTMMSKDYIFIADSIMNIKDIDVTCKELAREKKRISK